MKNIAFIGSASGWGAQVRGTEKGPDVLQESGITSYLTQLCLWKNTIYPAKRVHEIDLLPGKPTLPYIQDVCLRLSQAVENSLQEQFFPTVIGGDHSSAIGTWTGVTTALKAKQEFGLIWIDAHMDAHTMETTPSRAYHGMPLAALLGYGEDTLVNLGGEKGPVLNPAHVCLIGIRSYEEGEAALLKRLGVRIYYIQDVEEKGFATILQEALNYVKNGTKAFGLSLDMDAFDPSDAPGVGTPEPNGLRAVDVLPTLSLVRNDPLFKALEIVEYNPERDRADKTLFLLRDVLATLL